jgi:Arc/MetJ-type ribon-helix-helix transcriptional regulator
MSRQTMTISLPPSMVREVDMHRKREHRTRSELVREALRTYFTKARAIPTYTPTAKELRAIERGRAAIRHGDRLTVEEARAYVERLAQKARPQKRRPRAKA